MWTVVQMIINVIMRAAVSDMRQCLPAVMDTGCRDDPSHNVPQCPTLVLLLHVGLKYCTRFSLYYVNLRKCLRKLRSCKLYVIVVSWYSMCVLLLLIGLYLFLFILYSKFCVRIVLDLRINFIFGNKFS